MEEAPRVINIAGPNGAEKLTFAREFLPSETACPVFVNTDLIAAGVAPFAPEAAALRVQQGGHNIPEEVIRRRFAAGEDHFEKLYTPQMDAWALYDNSGSSPVPVNWRDR